MKKEIQKLFSILGTIAQKEKITLHLVGGFLRDYLLKIANNDLDFIVSKKAKFFAQQVAKNLHGTFVQLDEINRIYRVVWEERGSHLNGKIYHLDFSQIQGKNISEDLGRRDFTINTLALPVASYRLQVTSHLKNLIDPYSSRKDIRSKLIRTISEKSFEEDPLRLLRAFRFRASLNFKIERITFSQIKKEAKKITLSAPERIREELHKIFRTGNSAKIIKEMDNTTILKHLFPEIESMKKSARKFYFHPEGLWQHSWESLKIYEQILNNPKPFFQKYSEKIIQHLEEKVNGMERKTLLKFIILFHDVAKPKTAQREGKKMRFFGHEEKGAKMVKNILSRLHFSRQAINAAEKIIRCHMRPGNLTQLKEISNRAIYRYFRDLGEEGIDLLILSLADRYSYLRVSQKPQEIEMHHQKILEILRRYYEEKEKVIPPRLLNGYEVMKICQVPPGPKVGKLLRLIEEAQAGEKIKTKDEAKKFLLNLTKVN